MRIRLLHKLLVVFILVASLPILVAGLRIIDIAQKSKETTVLQEHIEEAKEVSSLVDFYINKWLDAMLVIASSQEQQTLDEVELENILKALVESYEDIVALKLQSDIFDSGIRMAVKQKVLVNMQQDPEPYLNLIKMIDLPAEYAIKTNAIVIDKVNVISELKKSFLRIEVPLEQESGAGALVGIIDLTTLQSALRQQSSRHRTTDYIIDLDGRLLAHPDTARVLAEDNMKDLTLVRKVLDNPEGLITEEYEDRDGVLMLGVAMFSPEGRWIVIIEEPLKDAYHSVQKMRRSLWSWMLFGIGLAALVAYLFAELFNRPIAKFSTAASAVATGDFQQSVKVKSRDELGELAVVFNKMTAELRRYDEINVNKLISEEAKIQAIIRNIADGIIATDTERMILFLNNQAEQWFGVTNEAVQQKSLVESAKNEKLELLVSDILKQHQESSAELTIIDPHSHENRVLKAHAAPVIDGKGQTIGVVTALRDITREKEIDQMKSEIVSVVSHELRTPLTSIQGFSQLLMEEALSEEDRQTYINIVVTEADRLTNMVNEFLDLSRLESGRTEIQKEPFNFADTIMNTVFVVSTQANEKNIAILPQFYDDDLFIYADPDGISQVMMNILSNAIKYSPPDREVIISVTDAGESIHISVKDNGFGMKQSDADKVFDKFYRIKSEDTKDVGGTGLGLPIVKEIIERHEKTITVTSELGKGSEFAFELDKADISNFKID